MVALTGASSAIRLALSGGNVQALMDEGVKRMDALFAQALAAGALQRDPSLDIPAPPPLPQLIEEKPPAPSGPTTNAFQVQITGDDVKIYNFAMAHLRTLPGLETATPQQINPGGTSYVLVAYHGSIGQLAAGLAGRGWIVETSGTVVKVKSASATPPALPPPPPPPPQPQPAPATQPAGHQE